MSHATEQMAKRRWANHGNDWPNGYRQCLKCQSLLPVEQFHKHAQCKGGFNSVCKTCRKPLSRQNWKDKPIEQRLWESAKGRATRKKREFNLELSDIIVPDVCPVLRTPMQQPSLDRINSNKGYIKGNVRVISNRANLLKNNASVAELELILADLKQILGQCELV